MKVLIGSMCSEFKIEGINCTFNVFKVVSDPLQCNMAQLT